MQRLAQNLQHPLCTYNPHQKSWNSCVHFPFPNVDLSITVVSVLQTTHGSTLGRVRVHYSALENTSVRSKSLENSRDAVCLFQRFVMSIVGICDEYCS